jgi:alanine-synthesizing transaminase
MFSSRTQWNTTPNRISRLVEEKRSRGELIVNLTESNPTMCGFIYPEKEIRSALSHESVLVYQPDPRGLLGARTALAKYYTTRGAPIDPKHVVFTSSTSEAYSYLFKLLCNPEDEILVPRPSYPLFEFLSQINDVVSKNYRLVYDGEWHVDFESLKTNLTDRTKAIVLIHPNNPTGSYIAQVEFDQICSLAAQYQCAIIIDEVFEPYLISSDNHRQYTLHAPDSVLTFSLNGISKLLGLPQLKLSWIIVHGNSWQTSETLNRLDILADTFLSVNTPVQNALPNLLQCAPAIQTHIRTRIRTNHESLKSCFAQSKVSVLNSEGGWYGILQLPQNMSDEEWVLDFLIHKNILVYPGHFFELDQKACIIISLLPLPGAFQRAIGNMLRFIEEK